MNPLDSLRRANAACALAYGEVTRTHRAFGQMIAAKRKVSRRAFAKKLGVTGSMLALMEAGERRWTLARAELAVKLLTRREQWPQ